MKRLLAIFSITYSLLKIMGTLLVAWLSLGWNVRKARKSFEAELMKEGISKKDAKRLSEYYLMLKNQMLSMMKSSFSIRRKYRTS